MKLCKIVLEWKKQTAALKEEAKESNWRLECLVIVYITETKKRTELVLEKEE